MTATVVNASELLGRLVDRVKGMPRVAPPPGPAVINFPVAQQLRYRFYDLMSRTYYGDLPLTGVTFGYRLNAAGSFNGTLPLASPFITDLHPLTATAPARTLLIIDMPGVLVSGQPLIAWGGIIWTRQFSRSSRALTLGGNEAWSYMTHRVQAKDYSTNWTTPADSTVIAKTVVDDALAVPYSALADMVVNINYQTAQSPANYVAAQYPITQLQTVENIVNLLAGMGYGVGFDFAITWAYDGSGIPRPTMTISYPRAGAAYNPATSKLLETQPAYDYTYPEDGTTQANKVYISGSSAAGVPFETAVDDPTSLAAGYPLLEEVANYPQINTGDQLSATASGELATHTNTPTTPVVDVDPFDPQFQLGAFAVGDDVRWVVPRQVVVPPVADERFPGGQAGQF